MLLKSCRRVLTGNCFTELGDDIQNILMYCMHLAYELWHALQSLQTGISLPALHPDGEGLSQPYAIQTGLAVLDADRAHAWYKAQYVAPQLPPPRGSQAQAGSFVVRTKRGSPNDESLGLT